MGHKRRSASQSISFNEKVTMNLVDSFKHELTEKEREAVWYDDVEMVIMKVDCGVFTNAAVNQQKSRREEADVQLRRNSNNQSTPQKLLVQQKKESEKAKALRK